MTKTFDRTRNGLHFPHCRQATVRTSRSPSAQALGFRPPDPGLLQTWDVYGVFVPQRVTVLQE